jgi:hypothetical protein
MRTRSVAVAFRLDQVDSFFLFLKNQVDSYHDYGEYPVTGDDEEEELAGPRKSRRAAIISVPNPKNSSTVNSAVKR